MAAPRSLAQALGPLLGLALLLSLLLAQTCSVSAQALLPKQLSTIFYATTCPKAEAIVAQRVAVAIHKDPTVAAPLLRLLFHDCFVRVSDASPVRPMHKVHHGCGSAPQACSAPAQYAPLPSA